MPGIPEVVTPNEQVTFIRALCLVGGSRLAGTHATSPRLDEQMEASGSNTATGFPEQLIRPRIPLLRAPIA